MVRKASKVDYLNTLVTIVKAFTALKDLVAKTYYLWKALVTVVKALRKASIVEVNDSKALVTKIDFIVKISAR